MFLLPKQSTLYVKPTQNKSHFDFIYCMHFSVLPLCVYYDF